MKITFMTSILANGGAERVMIGLATKMLEFGHTVSIISVMSNLEQRNEYYLHPEIKHIKIEKFEELGGDFPKFIFKSYKLFKVMKSLKSDVYVSFITPVNVYALAANLFLRKKLIVSERGAPEREGASKLIISFRNLLYPTASGIVFQTNAQREYFSKIKKTKSHIIQNPVASGLQEPYCGSRTLEIVGIGRLCYQKNFILLVEAFSVVVKKYEGCKLILYGRGPHKVQIIRRIKELGLQENVIFYGHAKNIHELIEKSAMFVLSSDYEGMPNALLEAMAIGMPVVSTDCYGGGPRDIIEDGKNGLLVSMNDKIALAGAMMKILENRDFAIELGRNASKVRTTNELSKIVSQWEDYIEEVTGTNFETIDKE